METAEQVLEQLALKRKKIQLGILLVGAGILASLVVGMALRQLVAGIVILIAALLAHFFLVRRAVKRYDWEYQQALIRLGTCGDMEGLELEKAGGLSRETFLSLDMFPLHPAKDSLISRNCFKGHKEGMDLAGAEVTFHYPADEKKKNAVEFLSGTLFMTDTPAQNPKGDWLLLYRGLLNLEQEQANCREKGFRRLAQEEENDLNEKYRIYTRGEETVLPAALASQLNKTIREVGYPSAIRLGPEGAAVFVKNWFYTGNQRPKPNPTAQDLTRDIFPAQKELCRLFRWWIRG